MRLNDHNKYLMYVIYNFHYNSWFEKFTSFLNEYMKLMYIKICMTA